MGPSLQDLLKERIFDHIEFDGVIGGSAGKKSPDAAIADGFTVGRTTKAKKKKRTDTKKDKGTRNR